MLERRKENGTRKGKEEVRSNCKAKKGKADGKKEGEEGMQGVRDLGNTVSRG